MSERKVLNKYYPPDFDASKLPRVKRDKNRQFTIRLMSPFNMRCKTCGEYIYRGKKFNARKEDVIGKLYLGIQIYRFYIKCTKCLAEITFLTDPGNQDYEMENGAIRNFECIRLAEKQAETEAKQKKDEEATNPMKILENRTRDSRREMAVLETLEDLRELNAAHAGVDPKILIETETEYQKQLEILQKEEDEEEIRQIFSNKRSINSEFDEEVMTPNNGKDKTQNNLSKKIKIEPDDEPKPSHNSNKPKVETKRSNFSLYVKKKEIVVKTEPLSNEDTINDSKQTPDVTQAKPQVSNSLSLLGAYGDFSDSQEEDDD